MSDRIKAQTALTKGYCRTMTQYANVNHRYTRYDHKLRRAWERQEVRRQLTEVAHATRD